MGEKQSKGYWQEDEEAPNCNGCRHTFTSVLRRHHCRNCGYVFCGDCSRHRAAIPMRGITEPDRVCDVCYLALRNTKMAGSTLNRGGPGMMMPNPSETPDRDPSILGLAGAVGPGGAAQAAAATAANGFPSSNPADAAAELGGDSTNLHPGLTEEQKKAEEYYQNLYGPDGGAGHDGADDEHGGIPAAPQETISPEALERERLVQRWNTVRQATVYVDILVQQSERVEPDTAVGYNHEAEELDWEPEMPQSQFVARMMPLPRPSTDSARYLLEPVKTLGMPASTLERVTAELTERLAVHAPAYSVKTASPDEFAGY